MFKLRSALLCALLALLPLSACGEGASRFEEIAAAAEATKQAGTARLSMSGTTAAGSVEVDLKGDGVIDFENQRGRLSMEVSGAPGLDGQRIDVLTEGLVMYMKNPALNELRPGFGPWLRLDLQAIGKDELGIDMNQLTQLGGNDPTQSLEWLSGAEEVETIGSEEVRGVSTTHFKGVLDFERLSEEVPKEAQESVQNLLDLMAEPTVPFEVWLDDRGRTRRMTQEFVMEVPGAGEMRQVQTIELFDFGTPVVVDIPPPAQVTDFQELQKSLKP